MAGRVLIFGGNGALGSALVNHFRSQGWWVCSVGHKENREASANLTLPAEGDWVAQEAAASEALAKVMEGQGHKLDSILNVAGGWAGGSAASKDFIKNADLVWRQSVWSSAITAKLANKHLKPGGCLVLTGASAALGATPGMIGYGLAKAAVHHLTKSLAEPKSGLPEGCQAFAILPTTLDTPMNRKWMPKADTTTWTPLGFVAELLFKWSSSGERPPNGSLVELVTSGGRTELVLQ